jgi:trimeric autotransporter adhesin
MAAAFAIVASAAFMAALPVGAETGTITTVAGDRQPGYSGDGGQARDAQMNEPRMLTFDGAGTMYIVDTFNQVVRRVGTDGVISTLAGHSTGYVPRTDSDCKADFGGDGGPATQATLSCPHAAAVASNGDLYIADSANHAIRRVDHVTHVITTVVGQIGHNGSSGDGGPAGQAKIDGPKGIIFDRDWNMIITDSGNDKIRRVDVHTGIITTIAGTGITGESGDGGPATKANLTEPRTMALGADGSILFTEPRVNRIRRIDPNGIISTVAGTGKAGFSGDGGPATRAMLNFNRGVGVDGAGNVWIADSLNQRIRVVDRNGIINTVAGTGKVCYAGPNNHCGDGGPASAAGFATPRALEFDEAGNVYVADTFNSRIRRIEGIAAPIRHFGGIGP